MSKPAPTAVHLIRRANLQALVDRDFAGYPSRLATRLGKKTVTEIARLLDPGHKDYRNIGERQAGMIEAGAGLEPGTLSREGAFDPPGANEPDTDADTTDIDGRLTWAIDNQPDEPRLARAQLAARLGVGVAEIHAAEAGHGRPARLIARLAPLLRANAVWIIGGMGARHTVAAVASTHGAQAAPVQVHGAKREGSLLRGDNYRAILGELPHRLLPLLGKVSAGAYMEAYEAALAHPDDHRLIACPIDCGPRSFWVEVEGASMTNPAGDTYPHGTLIAFDCDKPPAIGRPVIARLPTGECTLKNYEVEADGTPFLLALNPNWPDRRTEMPEGTHVCAGYVCRFLV